MKFCAYCYLPTEVLSTCAKCRKRAFCSKDCQKLDWKRGHKQYCGVAGELHLDFEVRNAGEMGLGLFALRKFEKNDKIMAERPLLLMNSGSRRVPSIPDSARAAVDALVPLDGAATVLEKVLRNRMSVSDESDQSGLFVTMSRVNHHCEGNSDHRYMEHRGVKLLVARTAIEPGEEITMSYTPGQLRMERQAKLFMVYGFHCTCNVCNDTQWEMKLRRAKELDDAIIANGSHGRIENALRQGKELIRLYDELDYSTWMYTRTYYDLFQVAITKQKHVADGRNYIRKAMEAALAYSGDEEDPLVQRYKDLCKFPQSHRNYLIM
jgi:MYND finger/SET domain